MTRQDQVVHGKEAETRILGRVTLLTLDLELTAAPVLAGSLMANLLEGVKSASASWCRDQSSPLGRLGRELLHQVVAWAWLSQEISPTSLDKNGKSVTSTRSCSRWLISHWT